MTVRTSCLDIAGRFLGLHEVSGDRHHPLIQWAFTLCGYGMDTADEVPWCSAFLQIPPFILGLKRSQSAAARSWLNEGVAISLEDATPGNDLVVFKRGRGPQPGPNVIAAPGHVGWFVKFIPGGKVVVRGGNQGDEVSDAAFDVEDVLGVRRLA